MSSSNYKRKNINIIKLTDTLNGQYQWLKEYSTTHSGFEPVVVESKTAVYAIGLRNLGNEKFRKALYDEALILYTKSAAHAIDGSEELALAYANRSAVLFRMCKYMQCLLDINRALEGKYPETLKHKLHARKKQCLIEIRQTSENTNNLTSLIATDTTELITMTNSDDDIEWRDFCNFENPLIPNASSKIKVEYDEKWGRHMVATEDIEPGELPNECT